MKNRNINHSDDWATPPSFYNKLNEEFNFNFDPCPYKHDIDLWDGLEIEWKERNFINPPYNRKLKDSFVKKAIDESNKGKLCVMLLPVSTSTRLFHDFILPNNSEIRFVDGRIKFCGVNTKGEYVTSKTGMHDSMVVIFDGRNKEYLCVDHMFDYTYNKFVNEQVELDSDLSLIMNNMIKSNIKNNLEM